MDGKYHRAVTEAEANNLIFRNEAKWRCARCFRSSERGRCISGKEHQLELHMTVPLRDDGASPAALTARDSEANMGIGSEGKVAAARDKVAAWPEVYDTKAPCIGWLRFPKDGAVEVGHA